MIRALITGASGFVGSNLARYLLAQGYQVILLLRKDYVPWRLHDILQDVRIENADLRDRDGVTRAIKRAGAQWIFHLAAYGANCSQGDEMKVLETNVMGTANLVAACVGAGFDVFVNTGSSSEYGFKEHATAETDWLDPNSYYAVTKASATMLCRHTARSLGLRIPTLRLYSVYGPFEEPTRLIPTLIMKGLENKLPPLVSPVVARDFVCVDDVVRAYLMAATAEHGDVDAVYNVGTGVQTTIREIVDLARRVLDISVEPMWGSMQNRPWDTDTWVARTAKMNEELGWHAQYSIGQGLRKTIQWFGAHPEMTRFYRARQSAPSI